MPLPIVTYAAKRSLMSGVTLGQSVTLTLLVRYGGLVPNRTPQGTTRRALSGRSETYYERAEVEWSIATAPLSGDDILKMRMFLNSTEDGQQFTFVDDENQSHSVTRPLGAYGEAPSPSLDSAKTFEFRLIKEP